MQTTPQTEILQPGVILITGDERARQFLAKHNHLQDMIPTPPFDHVSCVFQTKHSYVLASYDEGHAEDKDNGYTVLLISKALMTPEEANDFIRAAIDASKRAPEPCMTVYTNGDWEMTQCA